MYYDFAQHCITTCWKTCSLFYKLHRPCFQESDSNILIPGGGGGGGTPIYFIYRDVPTVSVSFSGSSVLNSVYNFTFLCLKQGCLPVNLLLPHTLPPPPSPPPPPPRRWHNVRWYHAPSLKCVKTQTYVPLLVFWIQPAWSSLEQGKKLQHFLSDRVAKFTSFVSWAGSGFGWVSRTPLPKFVSPPTQIRVPPPPPGS